MSTEMEVPATAIFILAVLHTFFTSYFQKIAGTFKEGSVGENFFHLLGEVEVVFGLWAGILATYIALRGGIAGSIAYVEGLNFTEPLFIFAIMVVAATKPVVGFVKHCLLTIAKKIPASPSLSIYSACLVLGPLMGSLITEPAAMTLVSMILLDEFYDKNVSEKFKYTTLAVLFVNISIGGVLTPYAAPPVLMVARAWEWNLNFMFTHFGWKACVAVTLNVVLAALFLKNEWKKLDVLFVHKMNSLETPAWLVAIHLAFLFMIVSMSHHPVIFIGLFLFFVGITSITDEHQEPLKIRQSLLVAFFLAGLVILGKPQTWWLQPLLAKLQSLQLFLGAAALTSITDNAALTFLGSQVENLAELSKYALVAGAVVGGGLTVIANAPNPAGYSILQKSFGKNGISPLRLFLYALPPTIVAMVCFWLL